MSQLHTTPASIAAALRRAADDLEALGDVTLSPIRAVVDLQAVRYHGTADERIATVDTLGVALAGKPGEAGGHEGSHYSTGALNRGDIGTAVYAGLVDYAIGGTR